MFSKRLIAIAVVIITVVFVATARPAAALDAVGDLTGNEQINVADLGPFTDAWNTSIEDPNYNPDADFNGDQTINAIDIDIMKPDFWKYATDSISDQLATNPIAILALNCNTTVENRQTFAVDFTVTYNGDSALALDAFIDFDPAMLQVTDATGTLVTDVTDTDNFENLFDFNTVDNTGGAIDLNYWNLTTGPVSSSGTAVTVATFYFTAQATGSTSVTFSTDYTTNRKTLMLGSDGATDITATLATTTITIAADLTPPVFSGLYSATDAETGDSIALYWTEATDDSPPITYNIYYATSSGGQNFETANATTSATTTYSVTGLTKDVKYFFVVRAEDSYGNEDTNTSEQSATPTSGADTTPPVFSGLYSATDAETGDSIALYWTEATDDSPPITYNIYYATDSGGQNFETANATTSATTTYSVTGLTKDVKYYFVVRAEDSYGNEDTNTSEQSATPTSGADTTPPSDPAYVYDGTSADIDFSSASTSLSTNWAAATDTESGISAYWYSAGTTAGASDVVSWDSVASSTLSITESALSLVDGTTYYFSVKAENGAGLYSAVVTSDGLTVDTSSPSPTITSPADGAKTNSSPVSVTGTVETGATVIVNGSQATVTGTGYSATTALSDGSNTITVIATDAAGNSASMSVTVSYDGTLPTATITAPSTGSTQSGTVTVTGTAADTNFSSFTLEYGTGSAPAKWKQVVSSSTSVSAGTLGTIDMSNLSGSYTIRLTASDDHGNSSQDTVTFTISGNEITGVATVSPSTWTQLSLPMTPDATSLNILLDSGNYTVYVWDPTNEDDPVMGKYEKPSSLSAGQGFWIKPLDGASQVSLTGAPVDTTADYAYSVGQGWNQVGPPFNWDFTWSNIKVKKDGTTYSYSDAVYTQELIAVKPFVHDDTGWTALSATAMSAGTGYLLYVYESGVSLVYDPGSENQYGVARIIRNKPGVNINISATGAHSADRDNRLGLAANAADGFDGSDLFEPPAGFSAYRTSLYFPHGAWTRHPGKYTFDFRNLLGIDPDCPKEAKAGVCKVWDFSVDSNESGTTMLIEWGQLPQLGGYYDLYLTDMSNNNEINMLEQTRYSYTTDGTARSFQVVLVARLPELKTVSTTLAPGWNLISVPVEPRITKALTLLGDDLDVADIFQYFGNNYYSASSKEGVDIQSGLGYWIYADEATQIDIDGVPSLPGQTVSVPLAKGWNLIGNPFESALTWGDNITIECGGQSLSLPAAIAAGRIGAKLFGYVPGSGYSAIEPGDVLETWKGYMLKAASECTIELAR